MIAPFWIAWKIAKLLWVFAVKPGLEVRNERAAAKTQQQLAQQTSDEEKARQALRERQLAGLKAAVPAGPPERMRATIQLNQYKKPILGR